MRYEKSLVQKQYNFHPKPHGSKLPAVKDEKNCILRILYNYMIIVYAIQPIV